MRRLSSLILLPFLLSGGGCEDQAGDETVSILAAASLGPTLHAVEREFEQKNPGVDVRVELSGSRLACNKVADQGRAADIVLSADYGLIDGILVPEHADFNLLFAANAVVIAYPKGSPVALRFANNEPWQKVLADPKVIVGVANPALAPVGYRAMLALDLNDRVSAQALRLGAAIKAKIKPEHQRPDVTKLIAPLEAGEVDVAFVYRSEADLHGLESVSLDPRIDFSSTEHELTYASVSMSLPAMGNRHARKVKGSAAIYGLTILKDAKHPNLARRFVELMLSRNGRALAKASQLQIFPEASLRVHGSLPKELEHLAQH